MIIQFDFKGTNHQAQLEKGTGDNIKVFVDDVKLEKQYGARFDYFYTNNRLDFAPLNPSHSDLYALQSQIKNAIVKQKPDLFKY